MKGGKSYIFIPYFRADTPRVAPIPEALQDRGDETWRDQEHIAGAAAGPTPRHPQRSAEQHPRGPDGRRRSGSVSFTSARRDGPALPMSACRPEPRGSRIVSGTASHPTA